MVVVQDFDGVAGEDTDDFPREVDSYGRGCKNRPVASRQMARCERRIAKG